MKIVISKKELSMAPQLFLRKAGYVYLQDRKTGQDSFTRRLRSGPYPRLHVYIKEGERKIIFNLHLDQKKPSYSGSHAHNAEYEGEVVQAEIERLKKLITHNL